MNMLYLKHRVVTSPLGPALMSLRWRYAQLRGLFSSPELALLREEDRLMRLQFRALLGPDAVCVDVGGHIGSISQEFRLIAPESHHIIVEASPEKAEWLRQRFPKAAVHQVAVSDRAGGSISFFENLDRPGYSSLSDRPGRGLIREVTVPCVTLDEMLADQGRIDLMKIDVEGHEYAVIRGAENCLQRLRPILVFEAGACEDPDVDNATYEALFRYLTEERGYRIKPVFGQHHNRPPITLAEFNTCRRYPFQAFNFFAFPPADQEAAA